MVFVMAVHREQFGIFRRAPCVVWILLSCALFLLAACSSGPQRAASIGEAYVGPSELKIRSDIPLESSTVTTVRHGDRLEILQQRRNIFLRVRTRSGAEGWTDARQLLSAQEMASLRDLAERARRMPSQGEATVYSDLRVRTQPSSGAPSFLLIKENEKFDVLAHVAVARTSVPRQPLVPPAPKKATAQAPKAAKQPKYPPRRLLSRPVLRPIGSTCPGQTQPKMRTMLRRPAPPRKRPASQSHRTIGA